ncbi:MAG TPA: carbohydrate ABC transporter permease [Streptosporangiaceae bacterium]|nr:carbohydrate ABC transporter permease [Streptosporangiaceae bacterium]
MARTFSRFSKTIILIILGGAALVSLIPLAWLLSTSFKIRSDVFAVPPQLIPKHPTLSNYAYVWTQGDVAQYFMNSVLASAGTVLLNLAAATLLGYALGRLRFRGREVIFFLGLSTMIIPFASIMLPLFITARRLGLTNNLLGIIIPTSAVNLWLSVYILREAFRALPDTLEEAAVIDGCSRVRVFWNIMLPLVRAPMATAAILVFTLTWSDFLWPLVIMRDQSKFTISVGLQYFMSMLTSNWHDIAAIAVLASLPTTLVFLVLQRFLFSGVLSGSSKG